MLFNRRCKEATAVILKKNILLSFGRQKQANRDADLLIKFGVLQTAQYPEIEETSVHNLSSKQLTEVQTKVLQRGSGFNTTDADPIIFTASSENLGKPATLTVAGLPLL
ncbi:unnamed protein product [Dibothriocephalus latus]|uniref:Uncharacterized protein n=1 Tax=Dibothriocephalus latus TaxID=60516 RepID=A0A3P7MH13_DIBLA|nr:unnamed protein product [Dibothriocephalus latus]